jgi:hypothetical protein
MNAIKSMLQDHMKDPEFAKSFFIEELTLAITEAVCEVLNSYGFKQQDASELGDTLDQNKQCACHSDDTFYASSSGCPIHGVNRYGR